MTGPSIRELFGDVVAGNHFNSISFECDPVSEILLISSHYSNGAMEVCHSLRWNILEQVKCTEPFKASYDLSRLKPLLSLADFSKSAAFRLNQDRVLSIQLMVPLSQGTSYVEFLVSFMSTMPIILMHSCVVCTHRDRLLKKSVQNRGVQASWPRHQPSSSRPSLGSLLRFVCIPIFITEVCKL